MTGLECGEFKNGLNGNSSRLQVPPHRCATFGVPRESECMVSLSGWSVQVGAESSGRPSGWRVGVGRGLRV